MYPLRRNHRGYEFYTSKGIKYDVYFTQLIQYSSEITSSGLDAGLFYYFGFHRNNKAPGDPDVFIKRTIALTLFMFLTEYPKAVVVFNYSAVDGRLQARKKKFKQWFDEYADGTNFKMFQHDFLEEYTVCAIYKRQSHPAFETVQQNIEDLIRCLNQEQNK